MWRMEDGDRVFTPEEWAAFRIGLEYLVDSIVDDEKDPGLAETGLRAFDSLTSEQKLALLADVAAALTNPAVPPPDHTAANEGAIAAVFEFMSVALEIELGAEQLRTELREALLTAARQSNDRSERLPNVTDGTHDRWMEIIELLEERVLWDRDYEMGDHFLDLPQDEARKLLLVLGIDPDYYLNSPREPNAKELIAVKQTLAHLLNRPINT
jgi:hypothetical protein